MFIILFGCVVIISFLIYFLKSRPQASIKNKKHLNDKNTTKTVTKPNRKNDKPNNLQRVDDSLIFHKWIINTLKGHSDDLLDFSINKDQNLIITASKDRFLLIWNSPDITHGMTPQRLNLSPDYALHVNLSPDNKAFIVHMNDANILRVYAYNKKLTPKQYKSINLPQIYHKKLLGFDIALNGVFILMYYDDIIIFINVKGVEIYKVSHASDFGIITCSLSPCSQIFALHEKGGSGLKLWKIVNYSMDFIESVVNYAILESTHLVLSYSFTFDGTKLLVVTKVHWSLFQVIDEKTGKILNEPIQIIKQSLTTLFSNAMIDKQGNTISNDTQNISKAKKHHLTSTESDYNTTDSIICRTAICHSSPIFALYLHDMSKNTRCLHFINILTGKSIYDALNINDKRFIIDGEIIKMSFYGNDQYLLLGVNGENRVYVMFNVALLQLQIDNLTAKIKSVQASDETAHQELTKQRDEITKQLKIYT